MFSSNAHLTTAQDIRDHYAAVFMHKRADDAFLWSNDNHFMRRRRSGREMILQGIRIVQEEIPKTMTPEQIEYRRSPMYAQKLLLLRIASTAIKMFNNGCEYEDFRRSLMGVSGRGHYLSLSYDLRGGIATVRRAGPITLRDEVIINVEKILPNTWAHVSGVDPLGQAVLF